MSQGRVLRVKDVAAYLGVSHQRGAQMYAEGKLPNPDKADENRAALAGCNTEFRSSIPTWFGEPVVACEISGIAICSPGE